jgi:hypothetical protein
MCDLYYDALTNEEVAEIKGLYDEMFGDELGVVEG